MAYEKKPGGRPYDRTFQKRSFEQGSGPQSDRQSFGAQRNGGRKPFGKPAFPKDSAKPFGKPAFSRDDAKPFGKPAFSRDGAKPFDKPAYRTFDKRPYGESSPRRAVPPRGPIPPAQEIPPRNTQAVYEEPASDPIENLLVGRNPIREALKTDKPIEKLLVAEGELTGSAREILAMAREKHVVVQYVDRTRLDQICKGHQGMLAYASAADYATVEEILSLAQQRGEDPLVVMLDGITDPHNLGAIIRSAECMGAHGVIVPERRAAGLVPAAVKASAGALSYIKVARVVNLSRTIDELKQAGLWVTGAVMDAPDVREINLSGPVALVIGSEGEGISTLVRQKCDQLASLPMYGQIESLNASVAAGILLYEAARSRHA